MHGAHAQVILVLVDDTLGNHRFIILIYRRRDISLHDDQRSAGAELGGYTGIDQRAGHPPGLATIEDLIGRVDDLRNFQRLAVIPDTLLDALLSILG